jgi:hypothetical protein
MPNESDRQHGTVERAARGHYRIVTHVDIDASADDVWTTLTDWDSLSSWSSSFVSLDGDFRDGGQVKVAFNVLGIKQNYEHILIGFVAGEQFAWSDPFLLGMVDHHVYRVEATGPSSSRFHQTDQAKGGASGVIGGLTARMMRNMYDRFNLELKAEAERRRSSPS